MPAKSPEKTLYQTPPPKNERHHGIGDASARDLAALVPAQFSSLDGRLTGLVGEVRWSADASCIGAGHQETPRPAPSSPRDWLYLVRGGLLRVGDVL